MSVCVCGRNKRTAFEKASKTCVRNRTRVRNVTTRKNHTDPTQVVCFSSFFLLRVEALTFILLFLSIYLAFFFIPSLPQLLLLFISLSPRLVFLHIIIFFLWPLLSLEDSLLHSLNSVATIMSWLFVVRFDWHDESLKQTSRKRCVDDRSEMKHRSIRSCSF